ncbi:gephyrin-like molybdotransferase Glp [Sungkyunkwania multivorans]|uniref:Molybdopterin molybdenumtransferase n=1 Tax=Sungkyunkwania multivorans TaxID=1173618 RepID=A0ABW3D3I4_9FLAO
MITVEKALTLLEQNIFRTERTVIIPLEKALGHTLATAIVSPINMPPFRQSAMDGYAIASLQKEFSVIGEIKAGDIDMPSIKANEAVRIFTGAPVPDDARAVVMQEKTDVSDGLITLSEIPVAHANIRTVGEQIEQGEIALEKGTYLNAAGIGFLATLGITEVEVYQKPSISIIATGNELIPPGNVLKFGQIYESNSKALIAALQNFGFYDIEKTTVDDNFNTTIKVLETAIIQNDIVIISGGISVGDYDFVGKALNELKVAEIFYKVKQKPGKPLFFGKKENTLIFALPGNPAASLSCFYIYVLPALLKFSGHPAHHLPRTKARISSAYTKKGDRGQFLKAKVSNGTVTILDGQASSMLRSFALANALAYIPEDRFEIAKNQEIEIIQIP